MRPVRSRGGLLEAHMALCRGTYCCKLAVHILDKVGAELREDLGSVS